MASSEVDVDAPRLRRVEALNQEEVRRLRREIDHLVACGDELRRRLITAEEELSDLRRRAVDASRLEREVEKLRTDLTSQAKQVRDLEAIRSSRSYRVMRVLWRLRAVLTPRRRGVD